VAWRHGHHRPLPCHSADPGRRGDAALRGGGAWTHSWA
jgi:hypothetical protein